MAKTIRIGTDKTCADCKKTYAGGKPPPGWKLLTNDNITRLVCAVCKDSLVVCRAAEFPVLAPMYAIEGNEKRLLDWREFGLRITAVLQYSRMLANWGASLLYSLDHAPDPTGQEKMEKFDVDLYSHIRQKNPVEPVYPYRNAWNGCMGSAGAILRNVQSAYKKQRFDILCSGKRSLQSFRSMPFPICSSDIAIEKIDCGPTVVRPVKVKGGQLESPESYVKRVSSHTNNLLTVTIPLPEVTIMEEVKEKATQKKSRAKKKPEIETKPKKKQYKPKTYPACKVQVILDSKRGFDRQVAMIQQVLSGEATLGSAAVYRKKASEGSNRRVEKTRLKTQTQKLRTFIKLVGHFPRRKPITDNLEILNLYTDPESFWVAEVSQKEVWVENADHIRPLMTRINALPEVKAYIDKHPVYLDRIKQDAKYERRVLRRKSILDMIDDNMTIRCQKMKKRLNTFINQSVAAIVGLVERQKVGVVLYTDVYKDYVPSFPWYVFRERLESKLPPGVVFRHANANEEVVESEDEVEDDVSEISETV